MQEGEDLKIEIALEGKIKNSFIRDALQEYMKRMNGKGFRISVKESARIDFEKAVLLSEHGRKLDPDKLQDFFKMGREKEGITFAIGGPEGFARMPAKARTWAISHLTLTAELTAVVLMEQLYRCWSAEKGKFYVR
mgnify:CR=1 FL=1